MNTPTPELNKAHAVQFTLSDAASAVNQIVDALERLQTGKIRNANPEIIRLTNFKTNILKYIEPLKEDPDKVTNEQLLQVEREASNALRYIGFIAI